MLAKGLVALSGALLAQYLGFADMTMGNSIIVVALASIIIGDTIRRNSSLKHTSRAIIGAISYKIIGGIAIDLGLHPNDLRAINAIIVIIFISYNNFALDLFKSKFNKGGKDLVENK